MKRILISLGFSIIILLLLFQHSYASQFNGQSVDFWEARIDGVMYHHVGYSSPANVKVASLAGGVGLDKTTSYTNTARNKWSFVNSTMDSSSPGTIFMFDGSGDVLNERCPELGDNYGITVWQVSDAPTVGTVTYGSRTKYVHHLKKAICYIPKQSISETNYKSIYVHEFGHAAGWFEGHCQYYYNGEVCVMYQVTDLNNYDLHWYDRRHIYQIYELLWQGE